MLGGVVPVREVAEVYEEMGEGAEGEEGITAGAGFLGGEVEKP